jgi:tartrate/fumarate subfamily iron-sulfur-dependent hydro-lyase alpha chain
MDDVEEALVDLVCEKASMACPPLIIGIGIGSTFDKVAGLSKKALLRDLDKRHYIQEISELEHKFLQAVNKTGRGPAGLGGDTTALSVSIEAAPCHIAALPVAINLGCSALRSRTVFIPAQKITYQEIDDRE